MSVEEYRAIVIGGGPGGYVAGIRLGQLGIKTLLIEKDLLGGECLNRGCIPSKILITGVNAYWAARKAEWVRADNLEVDWEKLQARREKILRRLRIGVKYLLEGNGVKVVSGEAKLKPGKRIAVKLRDGSQKEFKGENIIIATGAEHISIPAIPIDGKRVLSSSQALELREVPKRLLIVGGGVSGLELGILYAKLGSKVTVVELMDQLLPGIEKDLVDVVQRRMKKLGMQIYTSSKVVSSEIDGDVVKAEVERKDGSSFKVEVDYAMVAVGKRAATKNLGVEDLGMKLDKRGFIEVNDHLETNVDGFYAIGDVVGPPFLAHRASFHGLIAAENIAGKESIANETGMPSAIFTDPEIAFAGLTASEAEEQNIKPKVGKFSFSALGRAVLEDEVDGFVKIVADSSTGRVIGCQMVGAHVSELIAEATLAIRNKLTLEQFAKSIRPHPTFSESLAEAAEAALWKPIHMLVK
ncbi:MAG: dihydrolipoyl dehydrogenase [Thaumarchaeota archaeon]|nr:dihydrolipoyl dehydrogenase [Nitrososphaerota archaeon]